MKTALEILKECCQEGSSYVDDMSFDGDLLDIIEAMKLYAEQALDAAAEASINDNHISKDGIIYKSIINIKSQL